MIRILTDSASDILPAEAEQLGVTVIPLNVTLEDGTIRRAACMGGMLSMIGGECRLLATTFEWADAIDKERAERSKARAEAILAQKNVDTRELELAEARLKRALVRSSVASRQNLS